ncbi:MAG TPA: adenylate/guanylate cyclase domain-containing protein [Candidatus Elarobacter sp.]|jgi:class 3 adenylate cyclase
MTPFTAAATSAMGTLAVVALAGGRALRRRREGAEAAAAAALGAALAALDTDGIFAGVWLVLGLAAAARYGGAVVGATRDRPARLWAALERESAAKGRFLPRTLVDRLGRPSLAEVALGDRATEQMTVLFADIRDSTALTESLSSEDAFVLIADFFARSARVVRDHRGSVDKYLGDGFMALFPRRVEDALDAALALQAAVGELNREKVGTPIEIGVGLHTGPVTFGTVGDALHIDTTVVSDTVNTAKRVEGLSKRMDVPVVATNDVIRAVRAPERYRTTVLGAHAVRGKREPVEVYRVETPPPAPSTAPTVRAASVTAARP